MKDDQVYIEHILEAIERIEDYTNDLSDSDFLENNMVQDAVMRQIEIIGEAAKMVSQETKQDYSEIPWTDVAGMRDNLIHKYFGVDMEQVLNTVKKDIPEMKDILQDDPT